LFVLKRKPLQGVGGNQDAKKSGSVSVWNLAALTGYHIWCWFPIYWLENSGDQMRKHKIDHPHAKTSWEVIGVRGDRTLVVLMVETDLIHDPERDGFNARLFKGLKDSANAYADTQKNIDLIVFHTIGDI
jgi:hypothetical protein